MDTRSKPKELKDSSPIFKIQNSLLANSYVQRALWIPSNALSLGMIPMSIAGNFWQWWKKKSDFKKAASQALMGMKTGLAYAGLSAASIFKPSIGRNEIRRGVNPAEDLYKLYQLNPTDGFSQLDPIKYPAGTFTVQPLQVQTNKGELDAIMISPGPLHEIKNDKIIIQFCGAGHNYQQVAKYIGDDVLHFGSRFVVVNYPGVTNPQYISQFNGDLLNVGTATLHAVANKFNLTNQQIQDNVAVVGYSLGGGIVTHLMSYCSEYFGIKINGYINRSYSSISDSAGAGFYQGLFGIPFFYGKLIQSMFYLAGGGWDINSKKAMKNIDPNNIGCFNVENDPVIPRGAGFSEAIGKGEESYFKWNGEEDPEFKMPVKPSPHNAPNTMLFHPRLGSARDHFRLFISNALKMTSEETKIPSVGISSLRK